MSSSLAAACHALQPAHCCCCHQRHHQPLTLAALGPGLALLLLLLLRLRLLACGRRRASAVALRCGEQCGGLSAPVGRAALGLGKAASRSSGRGRQQPTAHLLGRRLGRGGAQRRRQACRWAAGAARA